VLRVLGFFFVRFFTYSLSASAGLPIFFPKHVKLAGQPVPSNTLPVRKALFFRAFNRYSHALSIGDLAIVPTERKFVRVAVLVFAAHMMERSHNAAFAGVHMGNRTVHIAGESARRSSTSRFAQEKIFGNQDLFGGQLRIGAVFKDQLDCVLCYPVR
jgi:hypothetical protein